MKTKLLLTMLFTFIISQPAFSGSVGANVNFGFNVNWGGGNQRLIGQGHNTGCYDDCISYREPAYNVPLRRVERSHFYEKKVSSFPTCEYYGGCEPVRPKKVYRRKRRERSNYVAIDECGRARCVDLNDYKTFREPDYVESEREVTSESSCDECGFESHTRDRGYRHEEGEIVHREKFGSKIKKSLGSLFRLNIGDAVYHAVRRRDEIRTGRRYQETRSWDNERHSSGGSYGRVAVR